MKNQHKSNKYSNKTKFLFFLTLSLVMMVSIIAYLINENYNFSDSVKTQIVKENLLTITNQERVKENSESLVWNPKLMQAAQMKADDMVSRDYFSHTDPAGRKFVYWVRLAGYDYSYVAENLAVKFIDSESVVDAWMKSEPHKKSLISDKYTEAGIGVALGEYKGDPAFFVVMMLGEPSIPLEYQNLLNK